MYQEREEEQIRISQEYSSKLKEGIDKKFKNAIANEAWSDLNDFELLTLKRIVENKSLAEIKLNVFGGDFYHQFIWGVINKLDRLGLIHVVRTHRGSVEAITFDESLESYIYQGFKPKTNRPDYLSFMLKKNIDKIEAKQPDYHNTFILPTEVVFKANEKYLAGAWLQTDGSLRLKFTPTKDIGYSVNQTRIEEEPKFLGDIIKGMFDSLGSDSKDEEPF